MSRHGSGAEARMSGLELIYATERVKAFGWLKRFIWIWTAFSLILSAA